MRVRETRGALQTCLALGLTLAACGSDTTKSETGECTGSDCSGAGTDRDFGLDLPTDDRGAVITPPTGGGDGGAGETDALLLIDGSLPPDAFKPPETCPTRDDGVCDEPSAGGDCPAGSDPEDCRGGQGPECSEAAECPQGEYCRLGQCVPSDDMGCTADDDCAPDEYCDVVTRMCNPDEAPGGCQRSADCAPGEICNLATNTCMNAAGGEDCAVDADCGLDGFCDNGTCVPAGGPVGDVAHGCDGPADCPEGICFSEAETGGQLPGGLCVLECLDDSDCGGGLCAPLDPNAGLFGCLATCRDSGDCRADWVCNPDPFAPAPYCAPDCRLVGCGGAGACDAATGVCGGGGGGGADSCVFAFDGFCDEPIDCAPGTDTTDCNGAGGFCIYENDGECDEPEGTGLCAEGTDPADCAGGGGCVLDRDCAVGEICSRGVCVPDPVGGCASDLDCAGGEVCRAGACVADPAADGGEGSRCGQRGPFCDVGLSCIGVDGVGTCRSRCNANANGGAGDCRGAALCVALEVCDPVFAQCDGFCFPDDDCVPGDTARTCGAPAYCDLLGPAAACATPGPGAVGDPCAPPGALGCQEGLACYAGHCEQTCDAQGACAGGASCVELVNGARLCLEVCDPFDAASCGALVPCAAVDTVATGTLGLCYPELREPRGVAGDACTTDPTMYWGDCNAAHVCAPDDPEAAWRGTFCQPLCDAEHTNACPAGSVCMGGLGPTAGTGVCFGECDPAAAQTTCADGNACRPRRVGLLGEREVLGGECTNRVGRLPLYEDCLGLDGECVPGLVCAAEERFRNRCLQLCDGAGGAHPCPADADCTPGTLEGLDDNATSTQWGVCIRRAPAPRCPLADGAPVPQEICNGVDDDCDGNEDMLPGGGRQLDCPAGQTCLGGQCF